MKFTLSWLKDHLDTGLSVSDLAEAMTMAGLEIETVEDPAAQLAAFSVAHVREAVPHPDADRLRVCTVDTKDGVKQIVCGAPNARAGMTAIYAPLGTFIPGLGIALDANPRKIRGVESQGMLCSAKEIEAGEDHDGIADLAGDWPVGTPAAAALGVDDPVIDFEVTPNRPDWLGVHGIARDLAAAGAGAMITPPVDPVPGAYPCPVSIALDWPEACPVFAGRVIRGVTNGPSPEWLRQRLTAIGLRPINLLVDVTNFISYDRARPLHVYDLAALSGPIRARRGKWTHDSIDARQPEIASLIHELGLIELRGEIETQKKAILEILDKNDVFKGLDGCWYFPTENDCVIADDARALGLGGLMGGEASGCTEATTDVFIESAWFEPGRIRATGRSLGVESDARYRFERGVDPESVIDGIELATRLILAHGGGSPSEIRLAGAAPARPAAIAFDPTRIRRLLGLDLSADRIESILVALGFSVARGDGEGAAWTVSPPSWRRDCTQGADLIEEIARIEGYDRLPTLSLPAPERGGFEPPATELQNRVRATRRALALRGYQEAVTWSFCRHDEAALFGGVGPGLRLANPISSELDVMRPSALIHLIKALQKSADRGMPDARYFEAGPIYLTDAPDGQAMVAAGARRVVDLRDWRGGAEPDLFDVKADALAALAAAGAPSQGVQIGAGARSWWHPGRSGVMRLGKTLLAEFGEIHPAILKALDVSGRVLAFEILLANLPPARRKALKARPALTLPELNPVTRDFAFLAPETLPAADLIRAVQGADKALIADVRLFDVYAGKGVPEGEVSLALEVTLQPRDRTLTDAEIETVSKAVRAAAEKLGARLRG